MKSTFIFIKAFSLLKAFSCFKFTLNNFDWNPNCFNFLRRLSIKEYFPPKGKIYFFLESLYQILIHITIFSFLLSSFTTYVFITRFIFSEANKFTTRTQHFSRNFIPIHIYTYIPYIYLHRYLIYRNYIAASKEITALIPLWCRYKN